MFTKPHTLLVLVQGQWFDKSLSQTHLLILESLPESQKATGTLPWGIDAGNIHFWEFILPGEH